MNTLPEMSLKLVISLEDAKITPWQLGYLTAAAKDKAYEVVLKTFLASGMSKAFLARRLGKRPEQITRWLGSPGNWTLDTSAILLAGMGYQPTFGAQRLSDLRWDNYCHPAVIADTPSANQPLSSLPTSQSGSISATTVSRLEIRIQ